MTKIYVGKIVNTHGIKGELRIKDELTKNQRQEIFKIGTNFIIDDFSEEFNNLEAESSSKRRSYQNLSFHFPYNCVPPFCPATCMLKIMQ